MMGDDDVRGPQVEERKRGGRVINPPPQNDPTTVSGYKRVENGAYPVPNTSRALLIISNQMGK